MIEILPKSSGACVGFRVTGRVTSKDHDVLLPHLDNAIAAHGRINLLVLMEDFEGWAGWETIKADFEFGTHLYRQVEKAALVGDNKWQEWIMDPFTRLKEERFFVPDQLDDAWQWVKEDK